MSEADNRAVGDEIRDGGARMMRSFAEMPSWTIVAVLSRIARRLQHFAEDRPDCAAVNDAIQVAEEAAGRGLADSRAAEFADAARRANEDAAKDGDPKAAIAALCAAEAAMAVQWFSDRPNLLKAAEQVVQAVQKLGKPDRDTLLADDIEQCAELRTA